CNRIYIEFPLDQRKRFGKNGKMPPNFDLTAAWHNSNQRLVALHKRSLGAHLLPHNFYKRMPNVSDGNSLSFVKLLLKRKDGDHVFYIVFQKMNAALPPCPDLRADEIENGDALTFEQTGDAEIEIRKINQDSELRLFFANPIFDPRISFSKI